MKSTVKPVVISLTKKTTPKLEKVPAEYICLSCKKNFLDKSQLHKHLKICKSTRGTRNTCNFCGKIFPSKRDLSQHHNEEIAICSFCNFQTCVKSELELHLEHNHKDHVRIFGVPSVEPFEKRKRKSEESTNAPDAKVSRNDTDDKTKKLKVRPNGINQNSNLKYKKKSKSEENVMKIILKKVKLEVQDVLRHHYVG